MADLTLEQLKKIIGKAPWEAGTTMDGTFYQPVFGGNAQGEAGQGQEGGLEQVIGYDPAKTRIGIDQYGMYDAGGKYKGQGLFKEAKSTDLAITGLLAALSMGMLLPGAMAGGAVGAGAAPGMAAVAGDAMMPGMLASTGGLAAPYGAILPGLEAYLAPAVAGGAAGAVAGDAFLPGALAETGGLSMPYGSTLPGLESYLASPAAGAPGAFNAAKDSQAANAAISAAGGDPLAGYAGMAGTSGVTGVPGGTFLDSVKNAAGGLLGGGGNGLGSLGGLATTALGGLLGAKGQESEATTTNKIDPRFDASIFGEQGVLGQMNALKNAQFAQGGLNDLQKLGMQKTQDWLTSPEYAAGYGRMANLGMGMMGRGVAANPFANKGA